MKHALLFPFAFLALCGTSSAQKPGPRAVTYSDAFSTLDDALGYIRYVLEKPQVSAPVSTDNRLSQTVIDSNRFSFGPLADENVKITYRFHAVTEVSSFDTGAPNDSVSVTAVDIFLESQFNLLDLLVYSPVTEKSSSGLAGIEVKLSQPRPSRGTIASYAVTRDGRKTSRPKDQIERPTEKVLLVCYNDLDRMRIANAFYQAQHIARTRNRLSKE